MGMNLGASTASQQGPRAVALLCGLVSLLAVLTAGLGVFARGDGSTMLVTNERGVSFDAAANGIYVYNAERLVAEGVGWDVVTLFAAVPALLIGAYFVARGSLRGQLFAAGVFGYLVYQYLEYAVTWAFGPLFLPFVAIYALSLLGILLLVGDIVKVGFATRFAGAFPSRSWAGLNVAMSSLLTLMWLGRIASGLRGDLLSAGLTSETTMTVQALDLGLVVPLSVLGACLVWRHSPIGYAFAAAWSVMFVGMAAAIVGMLLSAWAVEGVLEVVPVSVFGVAAVTGALIGVRAYQAIDASPSALHQHRSRASVPAT